MIVLNQDRVTHIVTTSPFKIPVKKMSHSVEKHLIRRFQRPIPPHDEDPPLNEPPHPRLLPSDGEGQTTLLSTITPGPHADGISPPD